MAGVRITYREAARRLSVGEATVRAPLRHVVLEQTPPPADGSRRVKAHASIYVESLDPVRAWLLEREAESAERERRRQQHGNPPDLAHVWLDTTTVAAMAGLTVKWAQWMIREEQMPGTFHGGRYWVRREHAEVIVAARAFTQRADERQDDH
ncbi:hypothetical protein [uncultured Nocardioides sp.]|uniref:hypothetical protein n=1 Tax=uncultured Nocardioides sp. TaxID=198441 RepID=UPI002602319C|nr:hypothetical protein [uncultured Nocardioides sp.]